ncbi:hypothetical protein [Vibrio navarrensis]|uniref:hypothetical protein n=1 Tax=Vibrio navarrensis TaxID=29495 RepID=UPI0029C0D4B6|nr:hypothetical protein [Vibrio navarrensis]
MQVLSSCLNGVLGLLEVSQLGAKSLWKFGVRFEFSENDLSKFSSFQIARKATKFESIRVSKLKWFVGFPNRFNLRLGKSKVLKFKLTNCLSGIRNAWHFQHAVSFVIKAVCGSFRSALLTP